VQATDNTLLLIGISWILVGAGLAFADVNRSELLGRAHTMPGLSLFRFPAFRWGAVVVLIAGGALFLFNGLGWI